jgi:hypothetical protein
MPRLEGGGLAFVGNVEYRQVELARAASPVQLFAGVTSQPTLADLRDYVVNDFVGELGVDLTGLQYYGYKLRQPQEAITPRELFELELVRGRMKFTDNRQGRGKLGIPTPPMRSHQHGNQDRLSFVRALDGRARLAGAHRKRRPAPGN